MRGHEWLVLLALSLSSAVGAQEAVERPIDVEVPTANVRLDGRTLFTVRGLSSLPANERAAGIAERLKGVAQDRSISSSDITVVTRPMALELRARDRPIMAVVGGDAELESTSPDILAETHRRRIVSAIETWRGERTRDYLTRSALLSFAITGVVVATALLVGYLFRRFDAFLDRRYRARLEELGGKFGDVMKVAPVLRAIRGSLGTMNAIALVVLLLVWAHFVLAQFPWTRWIADDFSTYLLDPIRTIALGIAAYLPNLIFLIVLALVARFALRVLRLYFGAIERGTIKPPNFEREWSMPTYKIVRTLVLIVALVMAYPYLPGSGTEALKGVSVFAGLLLSLGASGSVANVIAGYLTTFGRILRVGDLIKVGETMGTVTQVRLLTTRVRTIRNEEVTIPNALIFGTSVINYTALSSERGLVLQTEVGIGYAVPWRQVHALLMEAARRTPDVQSDPAPFVLQRQLGNFAVVYQLNVHKATPVGLMRAYSALHQNILDVFNEFGIQIMTPAYENDPEVPKLVTKEHWFTAPANPATPAGMADPITPATRTDTAGPPR